MRIVVNDFAGHPFQFQLSRELAQRGHEVMHTYFADLPGPKGNSAGVTCFLVEPITINRAFERYSYLQRMRAHYLYVKALRQKIDSFAPDVVLSGNMPTDAQFLLQRDCVRRKIRFVNWVQDFYAYGLEVLLTQKIGSLGKVVASPFYLLERHIFKAADSVVYISDDFAAHSASLRYKTRKDVVIENWASLDELPVCSKNNDWSRNHGLHDKFVFLYSGTMGLKHNPDMLVDLCKTFKDRPEVRVVLVSEGIGRRYLEEKKQQGGLDNLVLMNFQDYADLPKVLASADVLLANIERESSAFSVPSKILSYMCAGRPILMCVPLRNLAARVIERAEAGFVCAPEERERFLQQAELMSSQPMICRKLGENARRYAEVTFAISNIGDSFEAVLRSEQAPIVPAANAVGLSASLQ